MPLAISPAEKQWGYVFGVDGVWTTADVADFLSTTRQTIWRLVEDNRIRKGKRSERSNSPNVYCRRSVREYVRGLEE